MNFSIDEIGFKKYCSYSYRNLAKAYVVYAINCSRELTNQEWNSFQKSVLALTLRKNRIYVSRVWQQGKTIYLIGKQSHGCGYSWDEEILNNLYPLLNQLED